MPLEIFWYILGIFPVVIMISGFIGGASGKGFFIFLAALINLVLIGCAIAAMATNL